MKIRVVLTALFVLACCVGACSLNPQPLPPGQYDAGALDASKGGNDATTFGDAGGVPEDAGSDSEPTSAEAGEDASDAGDASEIDAGDAEVDAPIDALGD